MSSAIPSTRLSREKRWELIAITQVLLCPRTRAPGRRSAKGRVSMHVGPCRGPAGPSACTLSPLIQDID